LQIKFRLAYPTSVPSLDFLLLFHQGKSKSPSVAVSRGKTEQEAKPAIVILNAVKNLSKRSFVPQDDRKLLKAKTMESLPYQSQITHSSKIASSAEKASSQ
jgi:hypothetical protein